MQLPDYINNIDPNKVVTWSALLTAFLAFWKRIKRFFYFFYRLYKAVEKVESIETQLVNANHDKIIETLEKLNDTIEELRNDVYRLHQIQLLFTNTEDYGFFFCDLEGNNLEVNRKYAKELDTSIEDLKGMNWISFIDSPDEYEKLWKKAFKESRNFDTRLSFINSEGKRITGTLKCYLIIDLKGPCGYAGFIYFD